MDLCGNKEKGVSHLCFSEYVQKLRCACVCGHIWFEKLWVTGVQTRRHILSFLSKSENKRKVCCEKVSVVLAVPTYQFFSGGNRPWRLGLLVTCTCRMGTSHSEVESFDPVRCGERPYKKQRGFIPMRNSRACESGGVSCMRCPCDSAARARPRASAARALSTCLSCTSLASTNHSLVYPSSL